MARSSHMVQVPSYRRCAFSVFVASVWNDEHSIWDETVAREEIRKKAIELHLEDSHLAKDVAASRVLKGTAILEFLSHVREEGQFALLSP